MTKFCCKFNYITLIFRSFFIEDHFIYKFGLYVEVIVLKRGRKQHGVLNTEIEQVLL